MLFIKVDMNVCRGEGSAVNFFMGNAKHNGNVGGRVHYSELSTLHSTLK